jgi:hypothetical protein
VSYNWVVVYNQNANCHKSVSSSRGGLKTVLQNISMYYSSTKSSDFSARTAAVLIHSGRNREEPVLRFASMYLCFPIQFESFRQAPVPARAYS